MKSLNFTYLKKHEFFKYVYVLKEEKTKKEATNEQYLKFKKAIERKIKMLVQDGFEKDEINFSNFDDSFICQFKKVNQVKENERYVELSYIVNKKIKFIIGLELINRGSVSEDEIIEHMKSSIIEDEKNGLLFKSGLKTYSDVSFNYGWTMI